MAKKTLLVVVGPTAIGKTNVAIQLAQHYKCEIISADSRQFYKEMNIGTAVPTPSELAAATHHFIQHRSIHEPTYSVGDYETDAIQLLDTLYNKNNTAILVGGSGLYIDAVTKGLDVFPVVRPEIKEEVAALYKNEGFASVQKLLIENDPEYSKIVDLQNIQRVLRALEVTLSSSQPYSSFLTNAVKTRNFTPVFIGLTADRTVIYERINKRVEKMITEGLIEEVKSLQAYQHLNALNTVGYKEVFKYLERNYSLDFTINEIQKNTRRFAKRQGTWFRKNKDIRWFDYTTPIEDIITHIDTSLQQLATK
ncbi:tRNA (adenosine(37)-N6)-dimethylallyltransferase MiaA [Aquimarina sp. ERC-38]|uniref:tRNA (adenosine(37)-N6)-dimethylallyltransferase MiaA n=1 Tax=Aquimarina sp. ERC-38 TaxID=2949996 RepID=UPI00224788BE|nr:tRNA (adenosine(37)-N6)-dimethylallyltransferase MiaA [Aquimarina sp. ERC-38]UZO79377.1 tRNA (adenosine(37)-N6)-dimethylallyltransferase MiaA [Aquimarina sp. ERC-38]